MSAGRPDWSKSNMPELKETVRLWFQNGVGEGQFVAHLKNIEENQETSTKVKKERTSAIKRVQLRV